MAVFFNTKSRLYPDGRRIITYCNREIFSPKLKEENCVDLDPDLVQEILSSDIRLHDLDDSPDVVKRETNYARASVRAKQRIFDIAYCNEWLFFVTFTVDPKKYDHKDPVAMKKLMENWLRNLKSYHHFDIKYLIVPELGSKNGMIHFHCLISGDLPVVDSGTVICKGFEKPIKVSRVPSGAEIQFKVYNVPIWHYGFSTAIEIYKNDGALSAYFTKYMTKDQKKIFGKYYWSSQNIQREPQVEYYNTVFDFQQLPVYDLPQAGIKLKYESLLTF